MTVYDLVKHIPLLTANDDEIVLEVARRMVQANVGAVPVLRHGELAGMFSERDLMKRVVVGRLDPGTTLVRAVMTTDVLTVAPQESLDACMLLMKARGVRHLPICEQGKLVGMVSLRDLLLHDVEEKKGEVQFMRAYIQSGPS